MLNKAVPGDLIEWRFNELAGQHFNTGGSYPTGVYEYCGKKCASYSSINNVCIGDEGGKILMLLVSMVKSGENTTYTWLNSRGEICVCTPANRVTKKVSPYAIK